MPQPSLIAYFAPDLLFALQMIPVPNSYVRLHTNLGDLNLDLLHCCRDVFSCPIQTFALCNLPPSAPIPAFADTCGCTPTWATSTWSCTATSAPAPAKTSWRSQREVSYGWAAWWLCWPSNAVAVDVDPASTCEHFLALAEGDQ